MSNRARPTAPGPGLPVDPGERPRTSAGLPWPRITVVTPCYQAGRHLEVTIPSVLGQGYPDLEYLILDGGSTDGSVDVIERHAPHVARPDVAWLTTLTRGAVNQGGECRVSTMPGVSNDSLLGGHHLPEADGRRSYYGFVQQESTSFRRPLWDAADGLRPEIGLAADLALWLDFARTIAT